ncbi:YaiI/YqxD family protein [Feifania hominis]|uniref:UPF0178 protein H8695_07715 n=1 Tax=Feifania hominis TaxID=2763660 RepID=A0A926HU58_9FIRM|nr:YaiI/YqxD family protein [Feifania hominis]MBC8536569.1 YaiI/YqxD family protein [Feifania hominis]
MQILVDADACPVKEQIVAAAKRYAVPVTMFVDTSHILRGDFQVVTVDRARDSADIALANAVRPGDIVVSQDYGVAAMALAKGACALNQNGLIYTDENIDSLLAERHFSARARAAGRRAGGPPKRTARQDRLFAEALERLLQNKTD